MGTISLYRLWLISQYEYVCFPLFVFVAKAITQTKLLWL